MAALIEAFLLGETLVNVKQKPDARSRVFRYYERIATAELADESYAALQHHMKATMERPNSFSIGE